MGINSVAHFSEHMFYFIQKKSQWQALKREIIKFIFPFVGIVFLLLEKEFGYFQPMYLTFARNDEANKLL